MMKVNHDIRNVLIMFVMQSTNGQMRTIKVISILQK